MNSKTCVGCGVVYDIEATTHCPVCGGSRGCPACAGEGELGSSYGVSECDHCDGHGVIEA